MKDYFEVSQSDFVVSVKLKENIPGDYIESNPYILLDLEATSGSTQALAGILIKLPKATSESAELEFEDPYYKGTYKSDVELHTITIDKMITLSGNLADVAVVTISGCK